MPAEGPTKEFENADLSWSAFFMAQGQHVPGNRPLNKDSFNRSPEAAYRSRDQ